MAQRFSAFVIQGRRENISSTSCIGTNQAIQSTLGIGTQRIETAHQTRIIGCRYPPSHPPRRAAMRDELLRCPFCGGQCTWIKSNYLDSAGNERQYVELGCRDSTDCKFY